MVYKDVTFIESTGPTDAFALSPSSPPALDFTVGQSFGEKSKRPAEGPAPRASTLPFGLSGLLKPAPKPASASCSKRQKTTPATTCFGAQLHGSDPGETGASASVADQPRQGSATSVGDSSLGAGDFFAMLSGWANPQAEKGSKHGPGLKFFLFGKGQSERTRKNAFLPLCPGRGRTGQPRRYRKDI